LHYQNQQPDEGINVTQHNPLLHLLKLLVAALIIIVLVVVLINVFASRLGRSIPFKYEQSLLQRIDYDFGGENNSLEMQDYLNDLAERLAPFLEIPDEIEIKVHHNSDDVFNAFATLGGNVVFFSGLLRELPHENALAMVVAHEIAHVLHRDPVAGLGGSLASMLAVMALTGNTGTGTAGRILSQTGAVTRMKFGRDMERFADSAALAAVAGLYGHVAGADELFKVLQRKSDTTASENWYATFTSTHPLSDERISSIGSLAQSRGWQTTGDLTPLPVEFSSWITGSE